MSRAGLFASVVDLSVGVGAGDAPHRTSPNPAPSMEGRSASQETYKNLIEKRKRKLCGSI